MPAQVDRAEQGRLHVMYITAHGSSLPIHD